MASCMVCGHTQETSAGMHAIRQYHDRRKKRVEFQFPPDAMDDLVCVGCMGRAVNWYHQMAPYQNGEPISQVR